MKDFMDNSGWLPVYDDNSLSVWVPERWANDALIELEPVMAASASVHRDYSNDIAQYGDTVNVIKPGTFIAKRKTDTDDVTVQSATATRLQVSLNQHIHTSFLIRDGEESKGMVKLRQQYLRPAMQSIAMALDEIVLSQVYQFIGSNSGKIGTTPTRSTLINAREAMNTNLAPFDGRKMFITPTVEGALLNTDDFSHVEKSGDTLALKEGSLGRKYGWDIHMCQNTPSVTAAGTTITTAINNAGGYAAGSTSITMAAALTEAAMLGAWCLIAGDMIPHRITAYNNSTGVTTIEPALKYAVADTAAVTVFDVGAINQSTTLDGLVTDGYPSGWVKDITVDAFGTLPASRRMVTFGTASGAAKYGLCSTAATDGLFLDRPLEGAVADNSIVGAGPTGEFCFGFCRNAMALVMRPLAIPEPGAGAKGYVAQYKDLGIRAVITYDGMKQGHLVTLDLLAGIKVMDTRLGVVMFA